MTNPYQPESVTVCGRKFSSTDMALIREIITREFPIAAFGRNQKGGTARNLIELLDLKPTLGVSRWQKLCCHLPPLSSTGVTSHVLI